MNGHDGEVMGFPRVQVIYWGQPYTTSTSQALDAFFNSTFSTSYFASLNEYNVNMPTFLGSVNLPHDPTQSQSLSMDDMKNVMIAWLDGGLLPEVPSLTEGNLGYLIFLPPEITVSTPVPACAYHDYAFFHKVLGKQNLFFGVVFATSLPVQTSIAVQMQAASHELVEMFTDRSHNGWYASDGSEIADICSLCGVDGPMVNGIIVASYWRNSVGTCFSICGDGLCTTGESCGSCPGDCGDCPPDCTTTGCATGKKCCTCADTPVCLTAAACTQACNAQRGR
jgi:hypothetical protein